MSGNIRICQEEVRAVDEWLDALVGHAYQRQPLAQDWARVSKVIEEAGEAISKLILYTGQNPRKGQDESAYSDMLAELADVVITGVLAIQHFTKDTVKTEQVISDKLDAIVARMPEELRPC